MLVNHVTTNPFFVPTKYGAEDACKLLGCEYQWTGSKNSNVNEMVNAFNTAITGGADGIACCLVDKKAFNQPDRRGAEGQDPGPRLQRGRVSNGRLSYIGQDLFASGVAMGKRIQSLVPSGDVALFIATPGQSNIQPRIDGALSVLRKVSDIKPHIITTGAAAAGGAVGHPGVRAEPPRDQGLLRRRRRQHAGARADDPEAEAARQGRQGRRL